MKSLKISTTSSSSSTPTLSGGFNGLKKELIKNLKAPFVGAFKFGVLIFVFTCLRGRLR